ncbi:conjugal transfer protein TrbD [Maridesulfovibrio frigidus]|uniref:conjugal transfer protein TrbD n=1 Tax=Maridesulfovibrio frigidus TaxID=340956 RepID=UPI0004E19149|nr:conjugal transfer protein TrbD [Maridesulfovibrio frigidus]
MRKVPIHRSLHRPSLVMGAERDLLMYSALISMLVGIGGLTILSATAGFLFWLVTVFILRQLAKKDPQMSKIWRRLYHQQDFYPARSTTFRS